MSGPPPPPPPPPHGENPKTTRSGGLPPGKYDVFIIPEHSAGAGFLYLPSLRANTPSFVAGFATATLMLVIGQSMAPAFSQWWSNFQGMGNVGTMLLTIGVGLGAWSLGKTQQEGPRNGGQGHGPGHGYGGGHSHPGDGFGNGAQGGYGSSPPPPPPRSEPPPQPNAGPPPQQHQHQQPPPPPPPQQEVPRQEPPRQEPPRQEPPRQEPPRQEPPRQEVPRQEAPRQEKPKPQWQQRPESRQQQQQQQQQRSSPKPEPKGTWERAREEIRRKEEERRAKEEQQKKKEAAAARLRELREREARERAQRDKERLEREAQERAEREKKERELREELAKKEREIQEMREKEQRERELREQRLKELREKTERERLERLAREKAEKEAQAKKEEEERQRPKGSSYAFSGIGEKLNPWPNGKPPVPPQQTPPQAAPPKPGSTPKPSSTPKQGSTPAAAPAAAAAPPPPSPAPSSPSRKPPPPTARTYVDEEETFSYRPYDKPRRPHRKSNSGQSESSWAPSQSTARTTPPPSARMPYTTKDPDKIVIRAVYGFLNQFSKTPGSQLISGQHPVTDGLILRITTEGLFIDDDVRGVPQREWDVKAWTLKTVEVWCPAHVAALMAKEEDEASRLPHNKNGQPASANLNASFFFNKMASNRRGEARGTPKTLNGEEADAYLAEMLRECNGRCRLGLPPVSNRFANNPSSAASSNSSSAAGAAKGANGAAGHQTGEWKARGLHILRATIRDQEGKRFLFVVGEEEGWKVAVGLQRLRKGAQAQAARGLGVVGLSSLETKTTLEMLGWGA